MRYLSAQAICVGSERTHVLELLLQKGCREGWVGESWRCFIMWCHSKSQQARGAAISGPMLNSHEKETATCSNLSTVNTHNTRFMRTVWSSTCQLMVMSVWIIYSSLFITHTHTLFLPFPHKQKHLPGELLSQDPSERTESWHNIVDFYWADNWRALMEGRVKYMGGRQDSCFLNR